MTHMEMIKGIKGHGYRDELVIPIIENTPYEYELTDSLSEAVCYRYLSLKSGSILEIKSICGNTMLCHFELLVLTN
jgi:hypothetical protein